MIIYKIRFIVILNAKTSLEKGYESQWESVRLNFQQLFIINSFLIVIVYIIIILSLMSSSLLMSSSFKFFISWSAAAVRVHI